MVDILQGNGDGTFPLDVVARRRGEPLLDRGGRLRQRPDSTWPSPTPTPTTSRCSWATATGRFSPQFDMAAGIEPARDLVAGDFNGDGRLDLATGNAGSNDISVLLGKGDGTFEEPTANLVGYATRRPSRRATSPATATSAWPSSTRAPTA